MHNAATLGAVWAVSSLDDSMARSRWLKVVGAAVLAIAEMAGAATRRPANRSTDGAHLYRTECAPCHGPTGRGDGPDAALFSPPPRNLRAGFLDRYDTLSLVRRILDDAPLPLALDPDALKAHTDDVETIVAHVQGLPTVDWPLVEHGEEVYVDRCELCHGRYGHPNSSLPPGVQRPRDLSAPTFQHSHSDDDLLTAVRHGRKGMPALPRLTSAADAKALLTYIRLLSPGYETYEHYCASCHGDDGIGVGGAAGSEFKRPTVVFDRRYFATHDAELLRAKVWHMLAEQKPQMPHFRGTLTEPQVRAVVEYLKSP
jgi:mono/diheme cytochrome c family protein